MVYAQGASGVSVALNTIMAWVLCPYCSGHLHRCMQLAQQLSPTCPGLSATDHALGHCTSTSGLLKAISCCVPHQLLAVYHTAASQLLHVLVVVQHHVLLAVATGGKNQKRSNHLGLSTSTVSGVLLFSRGVYVCTYNKVLEAQQLEQYATLVKQPYGSQFSLIISGDFELNQERTGLTKRAELELRSDAFLTALNRVLDDARRRSGARNTFNSLLIRVNKEASNELLDGTVA